MPCAPGVVAGRRRGRRTAVGSLTAIALTWWLLLGSAVVLTMAERPGPVLQVRSDLVLNQMVMIHLPGLDWLPIPVERAAFEEAQGGFRDGDEDAIEHAFTAYEWIRVSHHQAVRVVTIDGEAIEIELLVG